MRTKVLALMAGAFALVACWGDGRDGGGAQGSQVRVGIETGISEISAEPLPGPLLIAGVAASVIAVSLWF